MNIDQTKLLMKTIQIRGNYLTKGLPKVASVLIACLLSLASSVLYAQTLKQDQSETPINITLSDEDEIRLLGIEIFQTHWSTENPSSKSYFQAQTPDENGNLKITGINPEVEKKLLDEDLAVILAAMRQWNLELKYPLNERAVTVGFKEEYTPDYLLFRAAMVNHVELAQRIVNDYEINFNIAYETVTDKQHALGIAVNEQHSTMVELLLRSGADPNFKIPNSRHPLQTAVKNKDTQSVRALFEAGAVAGGSIQLARENNFSTPLVADNSNAELVSLLLENGWKIEMPDPKPNSYAAISSGGTSSISSLMRALSNGHNDMVAALLPYSDPRYFTNQSVRRYGTDLAVNALKVLPPSNALFIAEINRANLHPNTEQAISDRIESLGGKDALILSRIEVTSSHSDLAFFAGDPVAAAELLSTALNQFSDNASEITNFQNPNFIDTVKQLLLKKHELTLIIGQSLSDGEQALINELADLGKPVQHWHAMLEVIKHAETGSYEALVDEWQQQYSEISSYGWDYSRLNNWIRSLPNDAVRKKAFRALDHFEFPSFVR